LQEVEKGSRFVDEAGATMEKLVTSIRRVTDLMGDISTASNEQNIAVERVGQSVAQMDQSTQQNAALVEEIAAAAASLRAQSEDLVQAIGAFKIR
jgi:methyl-accepting chemotaxis protein